MRPFIRRLLACLALTGLLASCSSVDPARYASQTPALDLRQYFKGQVIGHGLVMDRNGEVTRRFVVRIEAHWEGEVGTLDEDFLWSDGARERRVWTLRPVPGAPGRWTGTAADVVGQAQGRVSGNSLHWTYDLRLPVDGREFEIGFDDWMFLVDEKVMINRAVMSFWGIRVGEVLISFRKP